MPKHNMDFPKNFYWGAATSAHQVEGNNHNDWSEWETETADLQRHHAELRAKAAWPEYILERYPNPLQKENYISGRACDHYNRFREDFDIAKQLSHNAHRFSIEWSRIEPEEGKFDDREIEHYLEVIKALRERGLEPFVTLWHWPIPLWLRDIGGWTSTRTRYYFTRYVQKIVHILKNDVRFWITLNEPEVYIANSYVRGLWPPQKRNVVEALAALRNLIGAHKQAYEAIKKIDEEAQIGIAKNNSSLVGWLAPVVRRLQNDYFLNKIRHHQDFIGLNYYSRKNVGLIIYSSKNELEKSDLGWEIYPEGIYDVLGNLKKYGKPVYITENGVADTRDIHRVKFIREHLDWMAKAMQKGVDVRGYFHWSLLDNFEWDKGFWPRFGLVEIDYKTLERKIRPSAWEYKKIIILG